MGSRLKRDTLIDLLAFISSTPPSIENGSPSLPLNIDIILDSAIQSVSFPSVSQYLKYNT